jgi:hypothetical protein
MTVDEARARAHEIVQSAQAGTAVITAHDAHAIGVAVLQGAAQATHWRRKAEELEGKLRGWREREGQLVEQATAANQRAYKTELQLKAIEHASHAEVSAWKVKAIEPCAQCRQLTSWLSVLTDPGNDGDYWQATEEAEAFLSRKVKR